MKFRDFYSFFLLFVCSAAGSVLNAQQNVYIQNDWTGESFLMSGDYPLYTYVGNISNGPLYFNAQQWCNCWYGDYAVQSYPSGSLNGCCSDGGIVPPGFYLVSLNWETGEYSFDNSPSCSDFIDAGIPFEISSQNLMPDGCPEYLLSASFTSEVNDLQNIQWYRNGQPISGANATTYSHPGLLTGNFNYTVQATCPGAGALTSNSVAIEGPGCYSDDGSPIDYMLVQNVTTTGNLPGQSIQVQFDLSWGNTWKDDINWDAAWVFMKYKNAQGQWKHAKLSPTGHDNGQGTPNVIEPTSDQMGAFIRLATEGQGNFNAEGLQLRWNYSTEGLASVSGLEIRVFAIEMVYHPQGDFSVRRDNWYGTTFQDDFGNLYGMNTLTQAPGDKIVVVNNRLSPEVRIGDAEIDPSSPAYGFNVQRIKGDAGLDQNADGVVDNTIYPTGYYPFYLFKYELSDQQYADFLNCLTPVQQATMGVAGSTLTAVNGQYYSSSPNIACWEASPQRVFAYADWAGLRPMSFLEYHKAFNGPKNPVGEPIGGWLCHECYGNCDRLSTGNRGAGFYGSKKLSGNLLEPFIPLFSTGFNRQIHGNGVLAATGLANVSSWLNTELGWSDFLPLDWMYGYCSSGLLGFRLCRSAE